MGRSLRTFAVVATLSFTVQTVGLAQVSEEPPRVRPCSPSMAALIADAYAKSPTVQRLIDALEQTDVVVYVEQKILSHLDGQLKFAGTAAGYRYIRISLHVQLRPSTRIAVLAHELQHALEVARAPAVVNQRTLSDLFERIGYRATFGYETKAAREAQLDAAADVEADTDERSER